MACNLLGGIRTDVFLGGIAHTSSFQFEIIGAKVVIGNLKEEELVVISKKGQVIRTSVNEIPTLGRATQGVRVMRLYPGDSIASMVAL